MKYPEHHHALLCGLALAAILALSPARAAASGAAVDLESEGIAGTLLISGAIGFGVTDLAFAGAGRPMPVWLSLLQIGLSGVFLPLNALLSSNSFALGATAVGTGVWFTGHGIYNMAVFPEYRRARMRERSYGFAIAPRAQGGALQLYARL